MGKEDDRVKRLRKARQQAADLRNTIWDIQAMDAAAIFFDHAVMSRETYTKQLTETYYAVDKLVTELDTELERVAR